MGSYYRVGINLYVDGKFSGIGSWNVPNKNKRNRPQERYLQNSFHIF